MTTPWSDARGAGRLVIDLTLLVTEVVETMHVTVLAAPAPLGNAPAGRTRGVTALVYRSVRGVTRIVGGALDAVLAPLARLPAQGEAGVRRDAVVAALNGVLGDRLEASRNPLAIAMHVRHGGVALATTREALAAALPGARPRLLVSVHGLCMNDGHWQRDGRDHGSAWAKALDAETLALRYNSGRSIAANGADLAAHLADLVAHWPVPLHGIVLAGHSMGGLVIRSAIAQAKPRAAWTKRLAAVVTLGAPFRGAPLERAGHGVDLLLGASPYTAAFTRLARVRSAGITDLRHGLRAPLPPPVPGLAVAGSLASARPRAGRTPRGDGLVPVTSALDGRVDAHAGAPATTRWIVSGTGHVALLHSAKVRRRVREWLVATCGSG